MGKRPLTGAFFTHAQVGMAALRLEDYANPASLRLVEMNPAAARISNVPDAAVGKRIDEDFPEIARTDLPRRIADVVRTMTPTDLGDIAGVYDPSRIFTVQAFPMPPDCCGIMFEDVTDRRNSERKLRESEQRFRKLFDASPAAICVFDAANGTFVDVNPRFVELVGSGSPAAVIGTPLHMFGMWAEQGEFGSLVEALRAGRSLREATVTFRTYGGQVRQAVVALELVEIDGRESVLGLFWRA
ncbi:MAG: PAS domain-containing protein [Gemmatimonadales bacterium]